MYNRQTDVLSGTFHSRGYAFRIVGYRPSGCLDTDCVGRDFVAQGVQSLTLKKLRQLHADPTTDAAIALLTEFDLFDIQIRLKPIRHSVWRKHNRGRTKMDRVCARIFGTWKEDE